MSFSRRMCLSAAALILILLGIVLGVPLLWLAGAGAAKPSGPVDGLTGRVNGIPDRALTAYQAVDGWCMGLRWQLLAGIGSVESGHGTTGGANADPRVREVTPRIFGPALDGSPGFQRLPIGRWLGWSGLAGPWQQAVGPMQFLPGTFTAWAIDGDGDGVADPHDLDDATATAANYLCGGTAGAITDEHRVLLRYNNDEAYVARVLAYADWLMG